jgi:hypothetical protein
MVGRRVSMVFVLFELQVWISAYDEGNLDPCVDLVNSVWRDHLPCSKPPLYLAFM